MKEVRINNQISSPKLRVISSDGDNFGILTREEALRKAEEKDLDLIEISPQTNPPVAKIMDYGQWLYIKKRKAKQSRQSKSTETKSIQIKIGTGDNDLMMKARQVTKFLNEGHRVKIELYLRGRSKYFEKEFLNERLERFLNFVSMDFKIASPIKNSPKGLMMIIEKK